MATIDPATAIKLSTKEELSNEEVAAEHYNTLLRGELAAVNAYNIAREKFKTDKGVEIIDQLLYNHKSHIDCLRKLIISKQELPDTDTGAWGSVIELIVKSTKFLGETPLILALREGEDFGLRDYKSLLSTNTPKLKGITIINNNIIPNIKQNIALLNKLL